MRHDGLFTISAYDWARPVLIEFSLCSLLGLTMNSLASSTAAAAEPFEVTREVLLESGRFPIPYALAQTKEGGYVIAGTDQHRAWATRTDAEGNVQWRHILPMQEGTRRGGDARYESAAAMADDSTLLCGFKNVGEQSKPSVLGMLSRIDKAGQIVSHRLVHPQGDQRFKLNYFYKCVPWGDGFAVVGSTFRSRREGDKSVDENLLWLLALDTKGDVKWEKLIPASFFGELSQPLVMPNQDLVFSASVSSLENLTEVVRVDTSGNVKSQRKLQGIATLVHSIATDSAVHLFSIHETTTTTLHTLGESLEDMGQMKGQGGPFRTKRAYLLPDRSVVLFGYQRESAELTASMVKLSADLDKKQTFFLQPLWVSPWIADALPSGHPGGFVTIREIHPIKRWPDEKRSGLVLAFVRVK